MRGKLGTMKSTCCKRPPYATLEISPDNDPPNVLAPYVVCEKHLLEKLANALRSTGACRVALIDGSKRPPELSPEERKKRADQRDRGVLNEGPECDG